jgi:DeoR/GlpR family transcriptional regulator of sugar metabolism
VVDDLTVVTNSLKAADALAAARNRGMRLVLTGGTLTSSAALVGPMADASIRSLSVDLLFLGVHGMDPEAGFTTPNLAEAETDRLMVAHAHQVVVLADHTKWRTIGLSRISDLSAADALITDDGIDPEATGILQEKVRRLIIVRTDDSPSDRPDSGSR